MVDDILTEEDVRNILMGEGILRDKALFSVLYLSNSRVGEIVKRLKKHQIKFTNIDNIDYLLFMNLYTEKNRNHPLRVVPVMVNEDPFSCNIIREYIQSFGDDDLLFNITRQYSWRLIKKLTGKSNHNLRHTRLTHLSVRYDLDGSDKLVIAGWSDERPNKTYTHLRWKKVADRMKRNMGSSF